MAEYTGEQYQAHLALLFSSVSMDSGIESPQGYQITTNQLHNLGPIQPLIPTPGRPAASVKAGLKSAAKQNDHTTKEKLRRYYNVYSGQLTSVTIRHMDGWITYNFTCFSTVFLSYQEDGRLIMKGCVCSGTPFTFEKISPRAEMELSLLGQ